ncbi:CoA-binding protein [Imtechella halotolerans]|nr:CoA-binding protein [Imtechella halotolerans]WMQ63584.1 CoA-binding protein [Imtechella halotolerans]
MKYTLVMGASLKPDRYSYLAVSRLVAANHKVSAFGRQQGVIAGIVVETSLEAYQGVDTVTLYLNPKAQKEYYSYICSLQPKRVIFNPGTENPEFYDILKKHAIEVEVACTLVLLATNQY